MSKFHKLVLQTRKLTIFISILTISILLFSCEPVDWSKLKKDDVPSPTEVMDWEGLVEGAVLVESRSLLSDCNKKLKGTLFFIQDEEIFQ